MSVVKEQLNGSKGKKRGATNNASRLAGMGKAAAQRDRASWSEVNENVMLYLVYIVTSAGGAVRFGASRDGMVLSVGIYLDGDSVTLWLDGEGTQSEQLQRIYDDVAERIGIDAEK